MRDTVAKRYAAALFAIALERGAVQEFDDQAKALAAIFDDAGAKVYFRSPRIAAAVKKATVARLLAGQFAPELVSLVKLLVDKRRINYLVPIMRSFDLLTDRHNGVEEVTVVSAVPLQDSQLAAIIGQLRRFSAYGELRVKTAVDAGVLGGVKVRLGASQVLDGTVSSRLSGMRQRMERYVHRGTGG